MAAQCPKCNAVLFRVTLDDVKVDAGRNSWNGVAYSCPHCFAALSVGIDPVALKTDMVQEILRALGRR